MNLESSVYTQPNYPSSAFSSLEMGHATNSTYNPDATASAYLIFSLPTTLPTPKKVYKNAWFSLLADGVGDKLTCNVASQIAAESFYYYLSNSDTSFAEMQRQLDSAFLYANSELIKVAEQDNFEKGFCSSLLAAVVLDGSFFLASVGDCQAYLCRNDSVHRLTYESVRQRAVRTRVPLFPPKAVLDSPKPSKPKYLGEDPRLSVRHISFAVKGHSAVGQQATSRNLANHLTLEPEDVVVLCSNEISSLLGQSKIETIATLLPPQEAAEEIVQLTDETKADVSSSVIILRWNGDMQPAETYSQKRQFLRKQ